jgi:hypothetical protein
MFHLAYYYTDGGESPDNGDMIHTYDWGEGEKAIEPVLRLLDETGLAFSKMGAIVNLRKEYGDAAPGDNTVRRAVEKLEDKNLIEPVEYNSSYFVINERGREYLEGDLNLQDEEEPSE